MTAPEVGRPAMPAIVAMALVAAAAVAPLSRSLGFAVAAPATQGASALRGAGVAQRRIDGAAAQGESSNGMSAVASVALVATAAAAVRRSNRAKAARQALLVNEAQPASMPLAGANVVALSQGLGSATASKPLVGTDSVAMNFLMPKNIKWKKPHKPAIKPFRHSTKWKYRGVAVKGNKPHFGKYALAAMEEAWISAKQIESVRRALVRTMERKGKIWIRVFPHQAVTKRVAESRMGAGKGSIDFWVQAVRPNFILFELDGVDEDIARNAFRKAGYRLPCKTKMLIKEGPSMFELGLAGKEKKMGGGDPRARRA